MDGIVEEGGGRDSVYHRGIPFPDGSSVRCEYEGMDFTAYF